MNVLVIDDSSVMRKMIMRALRQGDLNANVGAEAGNGLEGLDALKSQAFDLVLCDWNMPQMNGLEFVKEARKNSKIPIVILTTETSREHVMEAMQAGADGYVTKPFTSEKLTEKLSLILDV
ncbi:MAG: response regulator [Planctomycetota bacterium]